MPQRQKLIITIYSIQIKIVGQISPYYIKVTMSPIIKFSNVFRKYFTIQWFKVTTLVWTV